MFLPLLSSLSPRRPVIIHPYTILSPLPYPAASFPWRRPQIADDKSCAPDYTGERNRFCAENIDYSDYLLLHSQGDHRAFCLAFAFTYRTFTESVMGFAWMASDDVAGR